MIRSDSEYQRTLQRIEETKAHYHAQRASFQEQGVPEDAAEIALQATESFLLSLEEDAQLYTQAKRGELTPLNDLRHIGRWLIQARIARGLSQKRLAEALGVSEAQVSRDERNEYHKISTERAQLILDAIGVQFRIEETSNVPIQLGQPMPYTIPSPGLPSAIQGYFRAKKNLPPERAAQVAQVLETVFASLTEDIPLAAGKE